MKVLWLYSHLVWLAFELGFHPNMHLFLLRKQFLQFFVVVVVVAVTVVVLSFKNVKREKKGWKGRPKGRCMVYKVQKYS